MSYDYVVNHWCKYALTGNPEHIWRIASHKNWLTPEEERMNSSESSGDRISELTEKTRRLLRGDVSLTFSPKQLEALQELVLGTLGSLSTDGESDPKTEDYCFWETLLEKLK